ncbi:MAG TPA: glycosyl transferase [Cytophagales bacterium]|nr:glycosyl transferase [Cytophagales bacterium]HAP63580.1 glycosyl transferase [Cytophagales bacterium]
MKVNRLTFLIPMYNEEVYISTVLDRVRSLKLPTGLDREVIVINDGSTDASEDKVMAYQETHSEFPLRYLTQPKNKGKGAALHRGIAEATGEFLVIQDADLEYDPEDILRLIEPVLAGKADVVYGSRFIGDRPHRVLYFWHYVGNRWLTTLTNLVTNLNLTDMETCYKVMNTRMVQSLRLREKRFGFEPEVTIKLSRIPKVRIYEVGISYSGRTFAEGKKISWKDGVHALWCLFRYGILGR